MTELEGLKQKIKEIKSSDFLKNVIPLKIAVLSSYSVRNINDCLEFELVSNGFNPEIKYGAYNQFVQELIDENSFLYSFKPNIIFVALDTPTFFEGLSDKFLSSSRQEIAQVLEKKLEFVKKALKIASEKMPVKIVITNLVVPTYSPQGIRDVNMIEGLRYTLTQFNYQLCKDLQEIKNVVILDLENIAAYIGKKNVTDEKYFYIGKIYLSKEIIPFFCREFCAIINAMYGKAKKCLVVDLDNTLWGGIVGEDGPLGIRIGQDSIGLVYVAVQKILLNYYQMGIILAINSKNNLDDVQEVFEKNKNMILRESHFACKKINWEDKAKNLVEIAKELNIGLDAIVFLDDSGFERENIKNNLPLVKVIEFPFEINDLPEVLRELRCFDLLRLTEEDKKRNELYAQENKRTELQKSFENVQDYLYELRMQMEIRKGCVEDSERITQLINKTNQFNLCTNRYSKEEIDSMIASSAYHFFSLRVSDRFGDMGLIAVCILKENDKVYEITDFLMSCRALGRGIEKEFLRTVLERLPKKDEVVGWYIPTKKNESAKKFYEGVCFKNENEDVSGRKVYKFKYEEKIEEVSWIKVKHD